MGRVKSNKVCRISTALCRQQAISEYAPSNLTLMSSPNNRCSRGIFEYCKEQDGWSTREVLRIALPFCNELLQVEVGVFWVGYDCGGNKSVLFQCQGQRDKKREGNAGLIRKSSSLTLWHGGSKLITHMLIPLVSIQKQHSPPSFPPSCFFFQASLASAIKCCLWCIAWCSLSWSWAFCSVRRW